MPCCGSDLAALRRARKITDEVFAIVRSEYLYERPVPQRHRIIFYIGHLDAFDSNLISGHLLHLSSRAPDLDRLFAFGIDPEPGRLPSDTPEDWPSLTQTNDYCGVIRETVDKHWNEVPEKMRHVAIEHRLMHAETLAYMFHNLPLDRFEDQGQTESAETFGAVQAEWADIPSGIAVLGRCPNEGFGWDNEFNRHEMEVPAFGITRRKVTNGEYLDFVNSGAQAPHYWIERDGKWHLRRMFDIIPLPLDWPVWVTQQEASAYAGSKGWRLPTEPEWHRAAYGDTDLLPAHGNFDGRRWDPERVTTRANSPELSGVEDIFGNGWEWTADLFRPFQGFQPFPFYPGYSADFFDDDHYVLKGASPRTDRVFLRRSFRNWFRKDYPYVFAGFRCIQSNS